tara:strand:+ start:319 stop:603 length:285 start_codon:yes stop_codon:yes gene_type:complete
MELTANAVIALALDKAVTETTLPWTAALAEIGLANNASIIETKRISELRGRVALFSASRFAVKGLRRKGLSILNVEIDTYIAVSFGVARELNKN